MEETPKITRRRENRKSTMKSGRTIGEKRERLETASERAAVHKKNKLRRNLRLIFTSLGLLAIIILVLFALSCFFRDGEDTPRSETIVIPYSPTIEIIDEAGTSARGHITSRMKEYVGQIEKSLREFGYTPTKAVIPVDAIREVDIYLDKYSGYIKMLVDRGAGVSAEDADRMLRYLSSQNISDFQYIDVRIEGKAYWK